MIPISDPFNPTDCGELNVTIGETTGVLSSPNYPDNYPNRARCDYRLTAPEGKVRMNTALYTGLGSVLNLFISLCNYIPQRDMLCENMIQTDHVPIGYLAESVPN